MARLVALQGPEAGGIRGQHLVAQHHVAGLVQAELELGVGNDDAAAQGVVGALLVQGDGVVAQLAGVFLALAGEVLFQHVDALLIRDVLVVVAQVGLGAGGVDGLGELVRLAQALGQGDAADLAGLLVAGPAAAGDVAADDALDGQHGQLAAEHAVALELGLAEEFGHIGGVHRDHVVGQQVLRIVEPELAHLGQDGALLGDLVFEDHVERRDAVGGHHDQSVAHVIDLAHFALFERLIFSHRNTLLLFRKAAAAAGCSYRFIVPHPRRFDYRQNGGVAPRPWRNSGQNRKKAALSGGRFVR